MPPDSPGAVGCRAEQQRDPRRGRVLLSREAAANLARSLTTAGRPEGERAPCSLMRVHRGGSERLPTSVLNLVRTGDQLEPAGSCGERQPLAEGAAWAT